MPAVSIEITKLLSEDLRVGDSEGLKQRKDPVDFDDRFGGLAQF